MVVLDLKPFAEGGMRWCVKMQLCQQGSHAYNLVAKIIKPDIIPAESVDRAYFDEAMTQTICTSFAKDFNSKRVVENGATVHVQFLPVSVVQLLECGGRLVNVEPLMEGEYVKHNDNDGNINTRALVPQAFSHFTWETSNCNLLVCDIQGVEHFFTDPQVHSSDGLGFGMGNRGEDGIRCFLESHRCNHICGQLGLSATPKRKGDPRLAGDARLQRHIRTGRRYQNSVCNGLARATTGKHPIPINSATSEAICSPISGLNRNAERPDSGEGLRRQRELELAKQQMELKLELKAKQQELEAKLQQSSAQSPSGGEERSQRQQDEERHARGRQPERCAPAAPPPQHQHQHEQKHLWNIADVPSERDLEAKGVGMSSGVRFEMVQKLQELRDKLQVLRMSDDGSRSRSQSRSHSHSPIQDLKGFAQQSREIGQRPQSDLGGSDRVSCRYCGITGSEAQVADVGRHHQKRCPRRTDRSGNNSDFSPPHAPAMNPLKNQTEAELLALLHTKRAQLKLQLAAIS